MITLRLAEHRGHANHGWLETSHTFSFADYYDEQQMGFRGLRVINEDRVAPGKGFGTHPHRDMEIITYVLEGAMQHRDSMGNGSVIRPSEVQRMSAGTGLTHSEFNASSSEPVHFLQIWLLPAERGLAPSYEQKSFAEDGGRDVLRLVASPDGRDGSVTVHADAWLYVGRFKQGDRGDLALSNGRHAWVHVAKGRARVNGHELKAGDGASLSAEAQVHLEAIDACELLVFDLS